MTIATHFDRRRAAACLAIAAAAAAAPASAGTTFTTDRVSRQIFCDMPTLRGEFHRNDQSYAANGSCVEIEAVQSNDGARNRSEFDQYGKSIDIWRASWTATGSYDPATKVTTETVTLPAPATTEYAPANRPYGQFVSRMVCATDPWLETRASCTAITVTAQGNLGSMEKTLRLMKRPFTSTEKEPVRDGLIAQHARAWKGLESHPQTAMAETGANRALVAGRSASMRNVVTEPMPARTGQTTIGATRPGTMTPPIATVPASAPSPYAPRAQSLDWGKAAPSALGSR